ncbi:hypothetical protein [Nonomuraea jabiensis]|uniref:hypothetical protein n=1 Tax=Nonomuraea jabiensis TaxID=882448 RepID=UPI003D754E48
MPASSGRSPGALAGCSGCSSGHSPSPRWPVPQPVRTARSASRPRSLAPLISLPW